MQMEDAGQAVVRDICEPLGLCPMWACEYTSATTELGVAYGRATLLPSLLPS